MSKYLSIFFLCFVLNSSGQNCQYKGTRINFKSSKSEPICYELEADNPMPNVFRSNYFIYLNNAVIYTVKFYVFTDLDSLSVIITKELPFHVDKTLGIKFLNGYFFPITINSNGDFNSLNCFDTLLNEIKNYPILFTVKDRTQPYILLNKFRSIDEDSIYYKVVDIKENYVSATLSNAKEYFENRGKFFTSVSNCNKILSSVVQFNNYCVALKTGMADYKNYLINSFLEHEKAKIPEYYSVFGSQKSEYKEIFDSIFKLPIIDSVPFLNADFTAILTLYFTREGKIEKNKTEVAFNPQAKGDTNWFKNTYLPKLLNKIENTFFKTSTKILNNKDSINHFIDKYNQLLNEVSHKTFDPYVRPKNLPPEVAAHFEMQLNDTISGMEIEYYNQLKKFEWNKNALFDTLEKLTPELIPYKSRLIDVPSVYYDYTINFKSLITPVHVKAKEKDNIVTFKDEEPQGIISEPLKSKFDKSIYNSNSKKYELHILKVTLNDIQLHENIKLADGN